jgi:hypothetical protein
MLDDRKTYLQILKGKYFFPCGILYLDKLSSDCGNGLNFFLKLKALGNLAIIYVFLCNNIMEDVLQ